MVAELAWICRSTLPMFCYMISMLQQMTNEATVSTMLTCNTIAIINVPCVATTMIQMAAMVGGADATSTRKLMDA